MEELLDYIERYFNGELPAAEKAVFEQRCETDTAFAEAVSFYIVTRQALKSELQQQKKKDFDQLYQQLAKQDKARPQGIIRKWIPYMAAACILAFIAWAWLFNNASPQQLADRYVRNNLVTLPVTMSGTQDSLQLGIAAFNSKDYIEAEKIFSSLSRMKDPEVYKHLGLTYLLDQQYDKAVTAFDTLSAYKELYANPGLFYKAVTLMKRSSGNDRQEAKNILQEVISKKLTGRKEAAEWIKHF